MRRAPKTAPLAVLAAVACAAVLALAGCGRSAARSPRSFDEIHALIAGKDAAELVLLLGEPDSRQPVYGADERWLWWNYTFLDGSDYPPELRGRVVHLEVVVQKPPAAGDDALWRVAGGLAVNYRLPLSEP